MIDLALDQPLWLLGLLLVVPLAAATWLGRQRLSLGRRIAAITARTLLLAALLLALAGLSWRETVDALGVVFVIDTSGSVGADGQQAALDFVREALAHQQPDDRVGAVVFGGSAMVEASPREDLRLPRIEVTPSPHHSDLAAGIRLASAILPADRARRIVVISDGEQTRGDAAAQVALTAGEDLQIATRTLPRELGNEVLVEEVLVPARVDERAPYDVRVVARATRPTEATLRLYRNDEYLGERSVRLGVDRAEIFTVARPGDEPGLYRYRAALEVADPAADTIPQNNQAVASVQVTGQPRVLIVDRDPAASRYLATALRGRRLGVDVVRPSELPATLVGFRPYAAIVLANVPSYDLTSVQQEAIEAYVRDLGRGLAMLGGDESFGVGGYFGTPIERALPVNMDIRDKSRFPKLGMVLAIDKSCSMGGGAGSKLGMAIEASALTIDLLQERDLFGLVAFDDAASWVVRLEPVGDGKEPERLARTLRTGGGTDIFPALETSIQALARSDASLKHVVLLSDGITASAAFEPLLRGGVASGVTTTTLAFGTDADRATMQDLARWGGGQYYLVTDPSSIPAIFTREALIASGSFLFEEPFRAAGGQRSDVLEGLSPADFPELFGYVTTEAKPRTVVALQVPPRQEGEVPAPLLVHGRYGLGRSLAFTSDATTRWAPRWVGTATYTQLWSQVGRWLAADAESEALEVAAEIRDGELEVTVDAFDEAGQFLNFLKGEARVIAPDLSVVALELQQVGPGRYRASAPVDQDGAWLVAVALADSGRVIGKAVTEAVQPWSPEYRIGASGGALMAEIGRLGGGGEITDPAQVFARPAEGRPVPVPLWPWLVGLAAFLLLLDVAIRRLRLWGFGGSDTVALVGAAPVPIRKTGVTTTARAVRAPTVAAAAAAASAPPEVPPVAPPKGPAAPQSAYASRLLAARRRAGLRDDDEEGGA